MAGKQIRVKTVGKDAHTAYISLPKADKAAKTVRLDSLLEYKGPMINLDLDAEGRLIGIEILVFSSDR